MIETTTQLNPRESVLPPISLLPRGQQPSARTSHRAGGHPFPLVF